MSKNQRNVSLVLVVLMLFALALPELAKDDLNRAQWCEGVTIRFFAGGTEGDAFAGIVYRGALAAERDLGANVEYVFSGWNSEFMTQQLREAVAQAPDGIAMMGHPGNEAIMPLAWRSSMSIRRRPGQPTPIWAFPQWQRLSPATRMLSWSRSPAGRRSAIPGPTLKRRA